MYSRIILQASLGLMLLTPITRGDAADSLLIGIQTKRTTAQLNAQFAVTAQRLRSRIHEATGKTPEVSFVPIDSAENAIVALTGGRVDVVALEPSAYASASISQPHVTLLCEQRKNQQRTTGAIIVHKENTASNLSQLAGQTVAFGPKYAATTGLLAKAEFVRAAVRRHDLLPINELDRSTIVAGVRSGDFAAGAIVTEATVTEAAPEEQIRVLQRFNSLGTLWAARAEMDAMTILAIQNALLQDPNFTVVDDEEFRKFNDSLTIGLKFDN